MDARARRNVLALQSWAGNSAVAAVLGRRAQQPVLARYEAPEHIKIGDQYLGDLADYLGTTEGAAWVKKYGLTKDVSGLAQDEMLRGKRRIRAGGKELTPGEVIALGGDLYASPEALETAKPKELEELLEIMAAEGSGKLHGNEANQKYQEVTLKYRSRDESYLELAKKNDPHFTPGNRAEWRRLHEQALQLAQDPKQFDRALLWDAFASHFLTDAFAAGHVFDKAKLQTAIELHLSQRPARPANPELGAYYGLVQLKGATGLLVLKNIHDRLNAEGVDVKNAKGMAWRTYGDAHLKLGKETQRIAALAVYLSRRQVYEARSGAKPKPDDVLAFLPDDESVRKATELAVSYIPAAVDDIGGLMYRQRAMAKTELPPILGAIAESNMATIASPARERQILEAQETARKTGLPTPAPQFTIAEW